MGSRAVQRLKRFATATLRFTCEELASSKHSRQLGTLSILFQDRHLVPEYRTHRLISEGRLPTWGDYIMGLHVRGVKVDGSELKAGFVIERKGRISQVLKAQHTVQGRGGATIQVELRDVQSGLKSSERLRTSEAVEKVFVDEKSYTFLYKEGDTMFLMEPNTFEQLELPIAFLGTGAAYLCDGMIVTVQYYDGKPLSALIPVRVHCTVAEAEPYFKGQTATPTYKKVVLENGEQILTPTFIAAGDRIVVDTTENLYVTRVKD